MTDELEDYKGTKLKKKVKLEETGVALKLGESTVRTPLDSTDSIIPERQTALVARELYCRHMK